MSNAELSERIKRNPLKIACVLVALVSGVGIYLINTKIDETKVILEQKTTEGARLETNVKNSAYLPAQVEELTAIGQKIQGRLVRASQLATNLQYFYRLETDSGIELMDLRQTSSGAGKANTGVGFSISVKGEYPTVIGFLQRLENGPHFCRILTASMSGSAVERAGPLTLSLSLELLGQP
jgi:hypothetical protein